MSDSDTIVVIPAFNEAKNIAKVITGVQKVMPSVDILVVNDGSRDATGSVAEEAGAKVIRHPFNLGYGVALQTAYKYAAKKDYQVILQIDGDGQHDPKYLKEMAKLIRSKSADVVIGSRFHAKGAYQAPLFRRIGMLLFNAIVGLLTGQKISDSTSGYQALNRSVLNFYTSDVYPWDFPDADVLLMLHYARFKLVEIPVTMYPAPDGKSMHGGFIKPIYYVFKMFLSILVTILRGKRISNHTSTVLSKT